jgi:hypothetical protein
MIRLCQYKHNPGNYMLKPVGINLKCTSYAAPQMHIYGKSAQALKNGKYSIKTKYPHKYNPGNYMLMQAGFKVRCKIFAAPQMLIYTGNARSYGMVIQYEQYETI